MRTLRLLFGLVAVSALAVPVYFVTRDAPQPVFTGHVMDRRCRGGCTEPPLPSGAVYVYEGRNVGGTSGDLLAAWGSTGSIKDVATQSTTNAKPVLRVGGLNGRNTVSFAGIYDFMTVPTATNLNFVHQTGIFDMFAVYRKPMAGQGAIFTNTNYNDTSAAGFWFDVANDGTGGGVYGVITKVGGATVTTFNTVGTIPVGVWRILEFGGDGTTAYASSDLRNGAVETQAFANPLASGTAATNTANIGAHVGGVAPLQGDLAAIYVWSRKLSSTEKTAFLAYCRSVWGL